jgi:hypothetical protein
MPQSVGAHDCCRHAWDGVEVKPAPDPTEKNSDPSKKWTVTPGEEVKDMSMSSIDRIEYLSFEDIIMDPLGVLDDDGASAGALAEQSMNFMELHCEAKGIPNYVSDEIHLFKKPYEDRSLPVENLLEIPPMGIEGKFTAGRGRCRLE